MKLHSEQQRFFYRVAGVVVHDGRVLMHKDDMSDFWVLPGGSCEFGEDSMSCLAREFREELDADVQVGRLLWLVENFFRFRGWDCHEIGLYYQVELLGAARDLHAQERFVRVEPFSSLNDDAPGTRLEFRWIPLEDIASTDLRPGFLKQHLADMPDRTQSVIHRDTSREKP
jgi:8-oxo-dGTP pyrophosphatase MutT (NUDIX family)